MLRLGLAGGFLTVRQIEDAAIARHNTRPAARVARHTCVGARIDVPPAYPVSHVVPGRQPNVSLRSGGSVEQLARRGQRHCRSLHRGRIGSTALNLGVRDHPSSDELCNECGVPTFVIAHAKIICTGNALDIRPGGAQLHGGYQREHPDFPGFMETRLAFFISDLPQPLHAAHIVDAVHERPPTQGEATFATPIIESRVTKLARSASLIDSVPGGRSGNTMYREAAVLSQTRTSTSLATSNPISLSTPRGSIAVRER